MTAQNTRLFIAPQLLEGLGPINAAAKKMAGQMGIDDPCEVFRRINSGEWVVTQIAPGTVRVWRTVRLGTCKSPDEYHKMLKKEGRYIGDWADDILGRISCNQKEVDLDLVVISIGDLGFEDRACYTEVCAKAVKLGLKLCPAEVGPALRLQYGDQPKDEWLRIAMEAVTDREGDRSIFAVGSDSSGLCLCAGYGHPACTWPARYRFVFVRPR